MAVTRLGFFGTAPKRTNGDDCGLLLERLLALLWAELTMDGVLPAVDGLLRPAVDGLLRPRSAV